MDESRFKAIREIESSLNLKIWAIERRRLAGDAIEVLDELLID
jgi:hypothetical protein